jgi:HSP20 family protein
LVSPNTGSRAEQLPYRGVPAAAAAPHNGGLSVDRDEKSRSRDFSRTVARPVSTQRPHARDQRPVRRLQHPLETSIDWRIEMAATDTNASTTRTSPQDEPQKPRNEQQQGGRPQQGSSGTGTDLARGSLPVFMSPFAMLQRFFTGDLTRMFDEIGRQRDAGGAGSDQNRTDLSAWAPRIDVVQRGNELVVRADLPGIDPDDVAVEIGEDAITISGERRQERIDERDGVYRVERAFGAFFREIPLPEGAITDQAKASFKDGVLEITVPAPSPQVSRGRRLEINREGEQGRERGDQRTAAGESNR